MGLFEKKYCAICGNKIGLFGNRKLEDGNLCKDCAGKLSPWFSGRRQATVAAIKEQLAYRERNKEAVAAFNPTKTFGHLTKVYLDEAEKKFIVTRYSDWRNTNPDVIELGALLDCNLAIEEEREEVMHEDAEGNEVSYNPPRFNYSYEFKVKLTINHPYIEEIEFEWQDDEVTSRDSALYKQYEEEVNAMMTALLGHGLAQRTAGNQFNQQPDTAVENEEGMWRCSCGTLNKGNFCANCGQKRPAMMQIKFCPNCGYHFPDLNETPKFCPNCGHKLY